MSISPTVEERLALLEHIVLDTHPTVSDDCCGVCDIEAEDTHPLDAALEKGVVDAVESLARIAKAGGTNGVTAAEALLRYSEPSPF